MVLEHQAHAANLITRANWEARLNQPARVTEAVETLVDYLLFVDEAPIPAGGIEGSSGFAEKFQATGPRDSKGRSLRDLDLNTRLLKYPLSYMIYSPAFAALPPAAKEMAMDRIKRVLSGEITGAEVRAPHAYEAASDRGDSERDDVRFVRMEYTDGRSDDLLRGRDRGPGMASQRVWVSGDGTSDSAGRETFTRRDGGR